MRSSSKMPSRGATIRGLSVLPMSMTKEIAVPRREYTGVYPYTLAGGRVLYRTLFTDSNGVQRQKRGFKTPTAAARFRFRRRS